MYVLLVHLRLQHGYVDHAILYIQISLTHKLTVLYQSEKLLDDISHLLGLILSELTKVELLAQSETLVHEVLHYLLIVFLLFLNDRRCLRESKRLVLLGLRRSLLLSIHS